MRVICLTSDDYSHLVSGFMERWREYVGLIPVTVVGYKRRPNCEMDEYVCLGDQPKNKDFTTKLRGYVAKLAAEDRMPVLVMLEDYWINKLVDVNELVHVWQLWDGYYNKFDLSGDRAKFPHKDSGIDSNYIESMPDARYRTSLQAAFWRPDYLYKFMVPGRTPWQFELLGEREAMYDGIIFGSKTPIIYYDNVMLKGEKR